MIIVVLTDPRTLPCVVQSLQQVRLHIETTTWCNKKLEAPGVFQLPDGAVCPACDAAIKAASPKVAAKVT